MAEFGVCVSRRIAVVSSVASPRNNAKNILRCRPLPKPHLRTWRSRWGPRESGAGVSTRRPVWPLAKERKPPPLGLVPGETQLSLLIRGDDEQGTQTKTKNGAAVGEAPPADGAR